MVHFEVKIYHHKVASFKDVCMVVVMVLGDKAQNYLPSSLLPPNNSFKSSCRYFGGMPSNREFYFYLEDCQMCASKSSNNGYYLYKIIILAMLRIIHVT